MSRLVALLVALALTCSSLLIGPGTAGAAPGWQLDTGDEAGVDGDLNRERERELSALAEVDDPEVVAERAAVFPDILHAHVDRFWALQFALAGEPYRSPGGVVGFAEPVVTACGPADPVSEVAFYCLLDETIYYSIPFRQNIEGRVGDFGWVVVVAHEWAHHVQQEIGIDLGIALDQAGAVPSAELEQQADCLAGAYSAWAEDEAWLDPGDIEEAVFVTGVSGDPPGTAWNSPGAHGSGEDRVAAYVAGYEAGVAACDLDLAGDD